MNLLTPEIRAALLANMHARRNAQAQGEREPEPSTLQADITQGTAIDDNGFQVELATVIENSFNIHQEGQRLVFREDENPQAKLMASRRGDPA